MLLHVFVERNIRDFHRLESLGAEIFNNTCMEVFGGDYEDVLPQPTGDIEQMRMLNQMIIDGKIPKPTPEMMEQIKRMVERSNQEHNSLYGGQPLVNQDEWDFLDDFLGGEDEPDEEEDIDWAEEDDANFDEVWD
jgi:hypothetical protein